MPQFDFHFTLLYFNIEEIGPWHHAQPEKKETNKQRKITITGKPWLCIFRRNHFMHCSLSRYWSCSSWRAKVYCAWWSYSSFNFILTTRETCTWARMWISSGVSRKWNIGCGVTKLPIEWPNLFTTKWKGISRLLFSCFWKFTCCKFNEIQISPKETWKLLLCFQLLRQNTSYSITVLRKKKLNIIIYVSGQKISLVWNFISFSQGMVMTSMVRTLWGGNREQKCFWATRDNRKWKYLFFLSTYLQANKFCLY